MLESSKENLTAIEPRVGQNQLTQPDRTGALAWQQLKEQYGRTLASPQTRRTYMLALEDFYRFLEAQGVMDGRPVSLPLLMEYRAGLVARIAGKGTENRPDSSRKPLSASTVNVYIAAVRSFLKNAVLCGYLPTEIGKLALEAIPSQKTKGHKIGRWLTLEEAQSLLESIPTETLRGKRNAVILRALLQCALRREELARMCYEHIQRRDGRWVFVDLLGKGDKYRSVAIPDSLKKAIDIWSEASGLTSGPILARISKSDKVISQGFSGDAVWEVVRMAWGEMLLANSEEKTLSHNQIAPHDLRRTCARLCRKKGAGLEQIQAMLGHASIQTTQIYLGADDFAVAPNDDLGL